MDLGTLKITDFVLELYVVKCYRAPVNGEEPFFIYGGEAGIRTLGTTLRRTTV